MNSKPIGVFDSGIGGLTVVRALNKRLPHENIVYFGDTARVPYGPKSPLVVREYAAQDVEFLLSVIAPSVPAQKPHLNLGTVEWTNILNQP